MKHALTLDIDKFKDVIIHIDIRDYMEEYVVCYSNSKYTISLNHGLSQLYKNNEMLSEYHPFSFSVHGDRNLIIVELLKLSSLDKSEKELIGKIFNLYLFDKYVKNQLYNSKYIKLDVSCRSNMYKIYYNICYARQYFDMEISFLSNTVILKIENILGFKSNYYETICVQKELSYNDYYKYNILNLIKEFLDNVHRSMINNLTARRVK